MLGDLQSYTKPFMQEIRSSMVCHIKPKAYKYSRLQSITLESYMTTHKQIETQMPILRIGIQPSKLDI